MTEDEVGQVLDLLGAVALFLGCSLSLVAAIGMVRFPDLLTRMHAATKPQVLGLMLLTTGVALTLRDPTAVGMLALVVLAQMVTAPVAAHMVGRASYRAGQARRELLLADELAEELPAPESERGAP